MTMDASDALREQGTRQVDLDLHCDLSFLEEEGRGIYRF